uniref:G-protein coupled receptor family C group 6 member A n=1 Tax=Esox lucius TaxID=8010 RepID=A0A6Q2Z5M6_ESOLU
MQELENISLSKLQELVCSVPNHLQSVVKRRGDAKQWSRCPCPNYLEAFNLVSFVRTLAVIYTIETINNSSFLPGVRLGYVICDTCADANNALKSTEQMLAINGTLPNLCDATEQPAVKAIIGARYSEESITVSRFLSLNMVPQISTTSTAAILSDKQRFPSFFRTVPSDIHQTRALAQLMAYFNWTWVGVVSGDDDYGKAALQSFLADAEEARVCTAFQEVVPHNLNDENSDRRIQEVVKHIKSLSEAQVVLLILKEELVQRLFKEIIKEDINRTWIASDAWSLSLPLATMKNINMLGDIFGFSFIKGPIPGFEQYLQRLLLATGTVNQFIEEYKDLRCSPEVQECLHKNHVNQCPLPNSVKFASHLACNLSDLPERNDEYLIQLKKINFTMDNGQFFFDNSSSFTNGYDLVNWARTGDDNLLIYRIIVLVLYNIKYNIDITDVCQVPESKCSESCLPGFAKKIYKVFCCYNCTKCEAGTFSNEHNLENCLECPNKTWSLKGWNHCEPRKETYFKWNEPFAITLVTFAGIGILLLFAVLIIFLIGRHSAVVKVAGGKLCFLMMGGLVTSFCAVMLFVGKPNEQICRSRQTLYGLSFTLCVSCILVKAYRTFLAFLMNQNNILKKLYRPPIIIVCGTAIQALICTFWLIFDSPKLEIQTTDDSMEILLQCNEGSNWGFGFMLGYIVLLALICFILALKGRKVPTRFNETGYIIFSVVIYIFVWVCFIPIYITKLQQRSGVQAAAIVVSNFGIIFCHFIPKCYMILCKNKKDITTQAYKDRVRIYSIQSTNSELNNVSLDSGEGTMESDNWVRKSRNSVITIHSSDSRTNFIELSPNSFSSVETLRKLDKLWNSSSTLRKRTRTQSI